MTNMTFRSLFRRSARLGAASMMLACIACAVAPGCGASADGGAFADTAEASSASAPLPSWTSGSAKSAIVDFVERVTREGAVDFVPAEERIAVFDNDGTLWSETPTYVQAAFVRDRVLALAPAHPEWNDEEPFKSILEGEPALVAKLGQQVLMKLLAATSAGMTTTEYERMVEDWIATARHPDLDRPYTELVYQPMLELLRYLRARGFETFIVSGGGVDFMRTWAERVYGIPPERVIGSRLKVKYEVRDGVPVLVRTPEIDLVDDGAGKPVGIHQAIGRRPIAAFGNSDGDREMLEWTTSASGLRFGLIVHHTDAVREWAYDRDSPVGKLSLALDEASKRGWFVVDMKRDWETIYPHGDRRSP